MNKKDSWENCKYSDYITMGISVCTLHQRPCIMSKCPEHNYQKRADEKNIKTDLSENIFLSERRCGKTLLQEQQWRNLKCYDCGGEMELIKNNKYEEVAETLE